jgi:hypothetical protein
MAKNILKEAIADAKAVREVALANAKVALEEAFTPKIQNMLSAKLSEELDEGFEEEEEINLDELVTLDPNAPGDEGSYAIDRETPWDHGDDDFDDDDYNTMDTLATVDINLGDDDLEEEIDLESIINELELDEAKRPDYPDVDKDGDKEESMEKALKDKDSKENKEELDEMQVIYNAETANDVHYTADKVHEGCKNCNEDFDLDTLLEEISNLDKNKTKKERKPRSSSHRGPVHNQLKATQNALNTSKGELKEAKRALRKVKTELNEVNLLNSKLLYVNRIFKSADLNDGQKLRVVEALDKAGSVKESKLIYETIKDSFSIKNTKTTPKKSIREGLGMASKAAGTSTAPRKTVLNESNDMVTRMQKLANIQIK